MYYIYTAFLYIYTFSNISDILCLWDAFTHCVNQLILERAKVLQFQSMLSENFGIEVKMKLIAVHPRELSINISKYSLY